MTTLRRLSYFGLAFLALLVLAACGSDGSDGAVELPSAGQYQFDVTATMEIELVEELASAAPIKGQPSQTVDLSGTASFDIGPSGGTFNIPEFGISGTIKLQGGDKVIAITLNPDQPSTGQVESDGTSLNLFLDFEVQDASTGGVIVGGYLFPVGTTEEPVPLVGRDADFFMPLILQFPPDLGRVSLTRTDTEETLGSVTAMALSFLQRGEEPTPTPTATPTPMATPAPTATPTPAATATPAPTPEPSVPTLALDCDHRIPGVESDVIVTVSGLQSGQTVSGSVTGPGVIGEGTFSAVANANGTAEARVPIDQFGPYEVSVDGLSGSIVVANDCPQG